MALLILFLIIDFALLCFVVGYVIKTERKRIKATESATKPKKGEGKVLNFIRKNYVGYLFVLPLIIGISVFTFYPIASSFVYSFFDMDLINPPTNFGFHNYVAIFAGKEAPLFWKSVGNTLVYAVISIPVSMVLSYLLALMIEKNTAINKTFRVVYYIPTLMPAVIAGVIWGDILNTDYGVLNVILRDYLGQPTFDFLNRYNIMGSFIGSRLLTIGGGMVIWIAAFKAIPQDLYEAASIDGAGRLRKFFAVTVPLSTPSIFYNLVTGIIGAFQVFGSAYVMTGGTGGDDKALLFVVMHIYNVAFERVNFGVSSAMSWILFAIIGILTVISFKTKKWVHYGEDA